MDVIILCRVSTEEQGESGLGLEAQEHACRQWCEQNGTVPRLVFREVIKGATPLSDREVLMDAVTALRKGSVFLVAKLDRLSRADNLEMAMVERLITKAGARVVSAAGEGTNDDSPANVFMRRILSALAEYERMLIGLRTKAALQAKRRRGERIGNIPYGWDVSPDGKTLVENPVQQRVLQSIRILRDRGGDTGSMRGIADQLNKWNIPTRSGKPWSGNTIYGILQRG